MAALEAGPALHSKQLSIAGVDPKRPLVRNISHRSGVVGGESDIVAWPSVVLLVVVCPRGLYVEEGT